MDNYFHFVYTVPEVTTMDKKNQEQIQEQTNPFFAYLSFSYRQIIYTIHLSFRTCTMSFPFLP